MGVRWNRVMGEWSDFKHELKTGSRRGFWHDYVDWFVESARLMPYTRGHVDALLYPLMLVVFASCLLL